jgi:hypothetical protein
LGAGATLIVALNTQLTGRKKPDGWPEYRMVAVSCAILSICWWGTFLKSKHINLQSWQENETSSMNTTPIRYAALPRFSVRLASKELTRMGIGTVMQFGVAKQDCLYYKRAVMIHSLGTM